MTDRLTLAHALENGGIARGAAEQIATQIFDAIHDNVATKTDLREMASGLQADLREMESRLQVDLRETEARLQVDVREAEARLQTNIGSLRSEVNGEIGNLRIEIERVRSELIRWVVGIGFAQVATIIALLNLLPGTRP
jgi:autotransporter translocation and assembly factor TamB